MYKNILIPMALDHGIGATTLEIAHAIMAEGGKITALHVYEPPQGSVNAFLDEEVVRQVYDAAKQKLQDRVKDLPGVTPVIQKGHTGRTIVDYADAHGIDCIVIGSHKPGLADFFLGSTAARVVRHAPCSVHVHRTE